MASTSNRVKLFKQCELGPDRISSLPCGVIGHILSFLATKEAVSTCILSTRWKHMWHLITKLDLNDDDSSSTPRFISRVYDMLLQCKGLYLSVFRLSCKKNYDPFYVNSWINAALRCNIQQLDILIKLENPSSLSRQLFSSTTLGLLKLNVSFVMDVPMSVCLPCLKVVDLSFVQFLDDDSFARFICGCPVLEELSLSKCIGEDVHVINIVSPLLTRLVLGDMPVCGTTDKFRSNIKCKIAIDTPSLMYLEMRNYFAQGYFLKDLHSLIEVHATICCGVTSFLPSDYAAITNLLNGVAGVQSLHLSWFQILFVTLSIVMKNIMSEDHFKLPKFPKLNYLELVVDYTCKFLSEMLDNSPNLETLVYKEVENPWMGTEWQNQPWYFHCDSLSKRLKVIEIEVVDGMNSVSAVVKFFLNNAKVLKKLIVQTNDNLVMEEDLKTVGYFRSKYRDAKKLTMEYYDQYVRRWVLDYTS